MRTKRFFHLTVIAIVACAASFVSCGTEPEPVREYTIEFDPDDGTPAPKDQTIAEGGKITEPPAMAYGGGGGGGTKITTVALSASQGDPGIIDDRRNK